MTCAAAPAAASAAVSASFAPHGMGLIPSTPATPTASQLRAVSQAGTTLPASVSLAADAMPVGNQGDVGSCAAWSSDYGALGYWENKEGIAGGGLEPMYTYSQVDGGADNGSSIEGNLTIDEQQGIDVRSDYWQGDFDYVDQPTAAERANAVNWRLSSFSDLTINPSASSTTTQTSIETTLAAGDPVVIGIPVYDNFMWVGSANNGYYAGISGSLDGYHAIVALGYNVQGLVIENSWGTDWGNAGWATLSWSFVNQYVFDAVKVGPLVTGGPLSTVAPTITGVAEPGVTVTASNGTWSPAATSYTYQWEASTPGSTEWSAISGATGSALTVPAGDVGDDVRVVVTATNSAGRGATSSGGVLVGVPENTVAPTVSGALGEGNPLTAAAGTWLPSGLALAYQWQRNTGSGFAAIPGATAATYASTSADVGAQLRVVVTGSSSLGTATGTSAAIGPIESPPVNAVAPAVAGTAIQGAKLTASAGTWSPAGTTVAYQWQRGSGSSWSAISGATATTYTLGTADVGHSVRIVVTETSAYGTAAADSAATASVASGIPAVATVPTVRGTAEVKSTLTATAGTWSPAATSYRYQWQRSANGTTWANVSGATAATYTAAAADAKDTLRVVVTAVNAYGTAVAQSVATGAVKAAAAAPAKASAAPKVAGPAKTTAPKATATKAAATEATSTRTVSVKVATPASAKSR